MTLVRAEFKRGVSLILGGAFQPMRHFAPGVCSVPYAETSDEDLEVYRSDGKRVTIPATSIRHWRRAELAESPLPIPAIKAWEVESMFLAAGESIFLDQLGQSESWRKDRHYPLTTAELRGRSVWITKPKGEVIQVPFHSIASIMCTPVIETAVPEQPAPELHDEWPAAEVTPAAPPRRLSTRKS